jgi:hypothetical protein
VTEQYLDMRGIVEVRLQTTGATWLGVLENCAGNNLLIHLYPGRLGVLPIWLPGTVLECSVENAEGRHYVEGKIMQQQDKTLWMHAPASWSHIERRIDSRMNDIFAVGLFTDTDKGIGACMDISASGMKLRFSRPIFPTQSLDLFFILPGDKEVIQCTGKALYSNSVDDTPNRFDIGIKFHHLNTKIIIRLEEFCKYI